jgi:hypothetical protein
MEVKTTGTVLSPGLFSPLVIVLLVLGLICEYTSNVPEALKNATRNAVKINFVFIIEYFIYSLNILQNKMDAK